VPLPVGDLALEHLAISYNSTPPDAAQRFLRLLPRMLRLAHLDLRNFCGSAEAVELAAAAVTHLTALTFLRLGSSASLASLAPVVSALAQCRQLRTFKAPPDSLRDCDVLALRTLLPDLKIN